MILTVFIAAAIVGRLSAVPILALACIIPAVVAGAPDEAIARAVVIGPMFGLAGVGLRVAFDRYAPRVLTARA